MARGIRITLSAVLLACALVAQPLDSTRVRLLAVGDLNLGRHVGQMLLKDSIDFPFRHVRRVLQSYDIVFGNLESQISDQGGITQHPKDPYIFSAPPQAARALKEAGFSVVSTANNHALDYGIPALRETIELLRREGVSFVGTFPDSADRSDPVIIERGGIRFGFLAYTQFVNNRKHTGGTVALFEMKRVRKEIQELKLRVDVVIVSFHGGREYEEEPGKVTVGQLRSVIDAGGDVVLGHHPHVPQGIERYNSGWIIFSLGNFVFHQPRRKWTQYSFAAEFSFSKSSEGVRLDRISLLPLRATHQPSFLVDEETRAELLARLQRLSNMPISGKDSTFIVYEYPGN